MQLTLVGPLQLRKYEKPNEFRPIQDANNSSHKSEDHYGDGLSCESILYLRLRNLSLRATSSKLLTSDLSFR